MDVSPMPAQPRYRHQHVRRSAGFSSLDILKFPFHFTPSLFYTQILLHFSLGTDNDLTVREDDRFQPGK